jgi:hypothetical protein
MMVSMPAIPLIISSRWCLCGRQRGTEKSIGATFSPAFCGPSSICGGYGGCLLPRVPVMLPPGRCRLVTRPTLVGSVLLAKTIGMVAVQCARHQFRLRLWSKPVKLRLQMFSGLPPESGPPICALMSTRPVSPARRSCPRMARPSAWRAARLASAAPRATRRCGTGPPRR